MSDLLSDYERKRGRAKLHLDALREGIERFTDKRRDPVKGEFQRNTGQQEFYLPGERFDPDWQLLIGDFAYNARASLDYLITALVRSTGQEENKLNEFPIYVPFGEVTWETIHDWWDTSESVGRQLQNTPPRTRAALKRLQPFYGIPLANPFGHPLRALYELNNRDKHRSPNLIARAATIDFVDAEGKPVMAGGPLPHRSIPTERNEGHTHAVVLSVGDDYADVDMYLLFAYKVAFHQPPELIGEVVETLTGIQEFIDSRVLPTVRSLL